MTEWFLNFWEQLKLAILDPCQIYRSIHASNSEVILEASFFAKLQSCDRLLHENLFQLLSLFDAVQSDRLISAASQKKFLRFMKR
jgi:hypothetical protein